MREKLNQLGPRVFAIPVAFCLLVALIFGTAMTPIFRADPHGIQFAVVNLDQGATISIGGSNIGDTMVEKLLSGEGPFGSNDSDGEEPAGAISMDAIEWVEMDSQQAVIDAMNAGQPLYGAIVIPEDFTAQQMNALVGIKSAANLKVMLNYGKNPQTANALQSTLTNAMLKNGITVDVEMVNQKDLGGGLMGSMMVVQFLCMPLILMCAIPSIIFVLARWPRNGAVRKERAVVAGQQIAFAAVVGICAALGAFSIVSFMGGISVPAAPVLGLLFVAAFSVSLFIQGLCDIKMPLGVLGFLCIFCFGMGTAMFGAEMMPQFWVDFVLPWAPQAALGEGLRQIMFMDWTLGMVNLSKFIVLALVGLVGMLAGILIPQKPEGE